MLDTDTCVYCIKNKPGIVRANFQVNRKDGIVISTVVLSELLYGVEANTFPEKNLTALRKFLVFIPVLPFDDTAAVEYGKIRATLKKLGTPIGPMDAMIAAHAKAEGLTLVTNNIRKFERVEGLAIVNWAPS